MKSLEEKVDELFAEWDKPNSPGCALGVIKDGRLIYARGYGMANLEYDIPITSKTVFRIGSTSKQFTAMCIALLAERGKLSLDDDIRKYIPEMPRYEASITIRHLIHHTSGIRDYLELMDMALKREEDYYTPEETIEMLARQKGLNFKPGEKFLYSNSNYFLLGVIVERVSGKSLREFAEENIFKPLGMENTHFHDDHTMIVKNRAVGYSPKKDGGFRICETTLDIVGDGGLFTTVEDLLLWDRNFYENKLDGGQKLIDQIFTPGKLNNGEELDYAFGLIISNYRGLKMVHHGGAFVGFRAEMIRFPKQRFSVICLANLDSINPTKLAKRVADIYLADQFKEEIKPVKFVQLPIGKLKTKIGTFRDPETGMVCRLTLEDGKLILSTFDMNIPLAPIDEMHFRSVDSPIQLDITFEKREHKPLLMHISIEERKPITLEAIDVFIPTIDELKEYEGTYFSDELQVSYEIKFEEGKIYFTHKKFQKIPLSPTLKDEFVIRSLVVRFKRDAQNRVTGFTLNSGRAKNVYFRKLEAQPCSKPFKGENLA